MLLLKATEQNWSMHGPGDWEKTKWKIEDDGWYKVTTSYRSAEPEMPDIPDVTVEGVMKLEDLDSLKAVLAEEWSQDKPEACDGTAWEFKMYEDGKVVKHRDCGYIYGIDVFERITALLPRE